MVDDTRELAVLYLEDSEQDAELVSAALEKGGLRCNVERVDSEEAFVAALQSRQFDVILSDFSMPGFDGKSGLRIAREMCPDTPFVFVSGTIEEDETLADRLRAQKSSVFAPGAGHYRGDSGGEAAPI
jgi:sigma-B regulation protein RsbU (phosphoserine phosphatase)